ncbi:MAG: YebC/PmpR family DNA-binding transcriptional regulator [Bacteroidetes bacterium]|nr:YebC/PmpR family DNA-binding transcriptional regulator [Bacteroidota bacterium]HET6243955.1 YebC/PmpR family DNA-binding transcriptional regulator [Bacteroidia bacterium]
MGRAFEFRRARKEKRWGQMAKSFVKLGKEIAIAVKQAGPDPTMNSRLRVAMQNAKGVNMPKDRIESAIKRASSKDEKDYQEMIYEGYGPHGIAILVECATDNPTRTVANIRMYFNRSEGTLGKTGSLEFLFDRIGVFKFPKEGISLDDIELDLIDAGAEEVFEEEGEIVVYTDFTAFGAMQKLLEEKNINVSSAELHRFPHNVVELNEEQQEDINKLIEKFEEDEDVQAVFHNMK